MCLDVIVSAAAIRCLHELSCIKLHISSAHSFSRTFYLSIVCFVIIIVKHLCEAHVLADLIYMFACFRTPASFCFFIFSL